MAVSNLDSKHSALVDQLQALNDKFNQFINGGPNVTINTGGGTIKSLSGIVNDLYKVRALQKIVDHRLLSDAQSDQIAEGGLIRIWGDSTEVNGIYKVGGEGSLNKVNYGDIYDLIRSGPPALPGPDEGFEWQFMAGLYAGEFFMATGYSRDNEYVPDETGAPISGFDNVTDPQLVLAINEYNKPGEPAYSANSLAVRATQGLYTFNNFSITVNGTTMTGGTTFALGDEWTCDINPGLTISPGDVVTVRIY